MTTYIGRGQLSEKVFLTEDGVVVFPGGWMHPYSFRDIAGEVAYQELLARPRIPSLYPENSKENK